MAIKVDNVCVSFGAIRALNEVSLQLDTGQIVAVIGANGSGKSTLFNSITGFVDVSSGSISIDGLPMEGIPAFKRISKGLARTFQTPRFDPLVSVESAVMCGFYPTSRLSFFAAMFATPKARREERQLAERCNDLLREFKLEGLRGVQMGELPMGQVRLVEVARAVANSPRYLLLDEPAAGLTKVEQTLLCEEIERLANDGVGVLLVEHNFNLVRELAEHVVVLDRGSVLFTGEPQSLAQNRSFVDKYLGMSGKRAVA